MVVKAVRYDTFFFYLATVQIDGSTSLTVGESATFTCTSLLGAADMIQWFLVDGGSETQQRMNTGQEALDLVLNPVSQSMDGNTYRCRVTNGGDAMEGDVTISVQGKPFLSTLFPVSRLSLFYPSTMQDKHWGKETEVETGLFYCIECITSKLDWLALADLDTLRAKVQKLPSYFFLSEVHNYISNFNQESVY